ncbi:hypothetical protein GCM10020367_36950 [Streptomyces sannanensis]|uniref:Uncharacterized protein n=1 Tax=Streptomyces sannanensis TaxID=285536 RepID=A0ABP6SDJ3_9ACTN
MGRAGEQLDGIAGDRREQAGAGRTGRPDPGAVRCTAGAVIEMHGHKAWRDLVAVRHPDDAYDKRATSPACNDRGAADRTPLGAATGIAHSETDTLRHLSVFRTPLS